jgi:hypothetical protein
MRRLLATSFIIFVFSPRKAFPDSCLPPKLAERVSAAGSVPDRLGQYIRIADKQNGQLGLFLFRYRSWSEIGEPKQAVKDIQNNPLAILECAWTETRNELEAWSPPGDTKTRDTLIQLDQGVAKAYRSFQRSAAVGPGPYGDEIKSIREVIEDVQALIKSRINPSIK